MQVLCNGFPKSGNHALVKAVELLGLPQPLPVNHLRFADGLPDGTTHHLFIVRDPRDVIVSWLRFEKDAVSPGKFLARFRKFDAASLVNEMATYEPWLHDAQTYLVRYEQLISDSRVMTGIANHLGVPYLLGAWEDLPGLTRTWNKERSNYLRIWTPEVQQAWSAEGGDELLMRWGY